MTNTELKLARERFAVQTKIIKAATTDNITQETSQQQEQRVAMLLEPKNYGLFFSYYFGNGTPIPLADSPCAPFHISSYLQLHQMEIIKQYRLWFRGAAKSIHTNVGNAFALKACDMLKFMVLVGANELRAKLLLADLQVQFEANERIIKDFGLQTTYGDWSDGEFQSADGSYFMALGLNQPFRGLRKGAERVDYAVVDDCEDREIALNPGRVQKAGEKILGDLGEAFGKNRQRMVVANNYITKTGIVNFMMEKTKGLPSHKVQQINIINKDGLPSWPERYTDQDIETKKANTSHYFWERELMNNPIEEGKLFKAEWIRFTECSRIKSWDGLIFHWDLSYTKNGDYKAGVLLGFKNNLIYVLKVFCQKCELTEAINWHYNMVQGMSKKGMMPLCFYDATASQRAVFMPIFEQEAHRRNFYEIPMPAPAPGVDKHIRIEATLTNVLFNRKIVFDQRLKDDPDFENAKNQLLGFEKSTKAHDDFPDTLEAAVRLGQLYFGNNGLDTEGSEPVFIKTKRAGF